MPPGPGLIVQTRAPPPHPFFARTSHGRSALVGHTWRFTTKTDLRTSPISTEARPIDHNGSCNLVRKEHRGTCPDQVWRAGILTLTYKIPYSVYVCKIPYTYSMYIYIYIYLYVYMRANMPACVCVCVSTNVSKGTNLAILAT